MTQYGTSKRARRGLTQRGTRPASCTRYRSRSVRHAGSRLSAGTQGMHAEAEGNVQGMHARKLRFLPSGSRAVRSGAVSDMRQHTPSYRRWLRAWRRARMHEVQGLAQGAHAAGIGILSMASACIFNACTSFAMWGRARMRGGALQGCLPRSFRATAAPLVPVSAHGGAN